MRTVVTSHVRYDWDWLLSPGGRALPLRLHPAAHLRLHLQPTCTLHPAAHPAPCTLQPTCTLHPAAQLMCPLCALIRRVL